MLSALRKRSGGIVVKSLLVLLILAFASWGIQDWLNPAITGNVVAKVGDQEISPYEVRRAVNNQMTRLRRMFGNEFTLEQARAFGIVDGVVNEQVNQALISQGAKDLGVTISDELIRQDIQSADGFKGLAGNFDRNRFDQVLAANGMTEGEYIDTVRRSLTGLQYADSLQAGTQAPKILVETIFKHRNEKRVADVALVKSEQFTTIAEPTDEQIKTFHTENAETFTAPEYRNLTFLRLDAADLAEEVIVTEEDIVAAYQARLEEFTTIERRNILQMVFSDEDKAKTAHQQLLEGRDFAIVAKEVAGLDEAVLDLGMISKTDLLPELADPAFALMQGTVSAPVKSALGWHIVKVTEVQPGGTKTLAEVRDQVKADVAREKAIDSLFDLSNALDDELGSGASIEEAAEAMNLKSFTVETLDAAGKDAAGNAVSSIPAGRAFIQTAFTTPEGEDSALTESGPEGFFVLRVNSVTPPALRPLETVRNEVIDAWKADQRSNQAKELAEKLVAEINAGGNLDAIATANGLTFEQTQPFTREDAGTVSGMNIALVEGTFDLQVGKATSGTAADGYQISVLKSVTPADPVAEKESLEAVQAALDDALVGDVTQQLVMSLRNDVGVDVNQAMLDQLFEPQTPNPGLQ